MTIAVEDRLALRDLVEAYARAADRVDGPGLAALFTPDGVLRVVRPGGDEHRGHEEIAAAIGPLSRCVKTMHFVGNQYVEVDGDAATGETYCAAHHVLGRPGDLRDHVMMIRYLDHYRRESGGWRFVVRELHVDWTEEHPVISP